jgi:spore coat polysaccharide biosynthesis protein SpsF
MGSTRLPGKHIRRLGPKTLLGRLIERLRTAETLDELVLATGDAGPNAPLAEEAARHGVRTVFHPDEDDVLGRIVRAARDARAEVVVVVLADTPLADPGLIDAAVDALVASDGGEYVTVAPEVGPVVPSGVDVYSLAGLERLDAASTEARHREHSGLYARENRGFLREVSLPVPPELRRGDLRLTVDTPADLELMRRVHEALTPDGGVLDLRAAVAWLDAHPEVKALNAAVQQRAGTVAPRPVVFACAGGPGVGLGHLRRSLFVAAALRDRHGLAGHFVVPDDPTLRGRVTLAGFPLTAVPAGAALDPRVRAVAAQLAAPAVVLDRPDPVPVELVDALRRAGRRVVVLDQVSPGARAADLAVLPVAHAADVGALFGGRAEVLAGAPYVLLDPALQATPPVPAPDGRPRILVTLGAADPRDLTPTALRGLARLRGRAAITVVVGALAANRAAVEEAAATLGATVVVDPPGLAPLLAAADVAVTAFGVTAYECAAARVPTVLLAHDAWTLADARRFARHGTALVAGAPGPFTARAVVELVTGLLLAPGCQAGMRAAAARLTDGRGAERVAQAVARLAVARTGAAAGALTGAPLPQMACAAV